MNRVTNSLEANPIALPWEQLIAYLATVGITLDRDVEPQRCAGGLANLNYRVQIDGKPTILRRAPSGPIPKGAHDMAREHRVLSSLADTFDLAPRSFLLCEDPAIFGAPFQLIEYRMGRVFRHDDLSGLAEGEDLAGALVPMLAETMTRLHAIDPQACGLETLGRPDGFVQRNINRWSKIGVEMSAGQAHESLAQELAVTVAQKFEGYQSAEGVLLHCDIKLDNLILAHDSLRPVALLDWDMTTLGDPIYDLATLLSYWTEPGDPEAMQRLRQMPTGHPKFPSRAEMVQAYSDATGRNLDHLPAMRALCQLKLAIVFLQLHARWKEGSLNGEKYAEFGDLGVSLLEYARDIALEKRA